MLSGELVSPNQLTWAWAFSGMLCAPDPLKTPFPLFEGRRGTRKQKMTSPGTEGEVRMRLTTGAVFDQLRRGIQPAQFKAWEMPREADDQHG